MARELVLLTGATGFIGFRVLVFCLRRGYWVRLVLRNMAKKARILSTPSIQELATVDNLTFVEIPDMCVAAVFDQAVRDVDYVIHVAAPIISVDPTSFGPDLAAHFVKPNIDAALHLLSSAQAHGSTIKRIIFTTSLAAIFDPVTDTEETIHTESTRASHIQPPPYGTPFEAYTAAKAGTLNRIEQWAAEERPSFDLVYMAPAHVFGPNELLTDPEELSQTGTNRMILAPVAGKSYSEEAGVTVHLDDVAEAHIRALDTRTPGNRLYILSSGGVEGTKLDSCFDIVARHFPEHVGRTLPNNGKLPSYVFKVDASASRILLGIDFMPYEKQVRDTVGYYIECLERKKSAQQVDQ